MVTAGQHDLVLIEQLDARRVVRGPGSESRRHLDQLKLVDARHDPVRVVEEAMDVIASGAAKTLEFGVAALKVPKTRPR